MGRTVAEIMNRELFSVPPLELAKDALSFILALGITAAPVVDDQGRPLGVVSIRGLLKDGARTVRECMTAPARTVSEHARIDDAAHELAERGLHRLVVVDIEGRAVGMASAIDLVRGLLGLPASHPQAFPHFDPVTGLTWTDDTLLDNEHVGAAPDGPGLIVLVEGGAGVREQVVWAESCNNLRARLDELLSVPQDDARLARLVQHPARLRFRAAFAADVATREKAVAALRGAAAWSRPGGLG
jgi:CBS domain-containing protein